MAQHTDIPTRAAVMSLLSMREPSCVSIYLPTSTLTGAAAGDRIELKNLAADAVHQLEEAGTDNRVVADVRDGLADVEEDDVFWRRQANSLALFATPRSVRTSRLPNRLTAMVEVSDRFHLKPLLRA